MSIRTDQTSPLVTPAQAADLLRISPRTLWRWESRGHITPIRLPNGYRRFRLDDLERLMAGRVA